MNRAGHIPNKFLGPILLTIAASSWGSLYVVCKMVLTVIEPMTLVWLRMVISAILLGIMSKIMGESWHIERKDIPRLIAIGLVGYVFSNWTQFYGTQLASAQAGSVLTATSPVFMVIFAYFILHEKITWKKWLSVGMSTVGVVLIVGVGGMQGGLFGGFILIIAAATWGLISVWVKQVPAKYPTIVVTMYCMLVSAIFLTPVELPTINGQMLQAMLEPEILAEITYISLVPTALAYYLWNKGLTMVDASTGGMYFFFQPITGTFLGWLFLGETIGLPFIIGTSLILLGIVLVVRE